MIDACLQIVPACAFTLMESSLRPSRTRYGVIVFAVMLGIIH